MTAQEVADLAMKSYCPNTGLARVVCMFCKQLQATSNEHLSVYHDFQCTVCGATNTDIYIIPDMAQVIMAGRLMAMMFYSN